MESHQHCFELKKFVDYLRFSSQLNKVPFAIFKWKNMQCKTRLFREYKNLGHSYPISRIKSIPSILLFFIPSKDFPSFLKGRNSGFPKKGFDSTRVPTRHFWSIVVKLIHLCTWNLFTILIHNNPHPKIFTTCYHSQ